MKKTERTQKTASNSSINLKCLICFSQNCPVRNKKGRRKEVTINGTTFVTMCPKDGKGNKDMYDF